MRWNADFGLNAMSVFPKVYLLWGSIVASLLGFIGDRTVPVTAATGLFLSHCVWPVHGLVAGMTIAACGKAACVACMGKGFKCLQPLRTVAFRAC